MYSICCICAINKCDTETNCKHYYCFGCIS